MSSDQFSRQIVRTEPCPTWALLAISARNAAYPRVYPRISAQIPAGWADQVVRFYLQIVGLRSATVLTERPYRTQEVGGSNPPSSIDSKALQMRGPAFGGPVRTDRLVTPLLGHQCPKSHGYAAICADPTPIPTRLDARPELRSRRSIAKRDPGGTWAANQATGVMAPARDDLSRRAWRCGPAPRKRGRTPAYGRRQSRPPARREVHPGRGNGPVRGAWPLPGASPHRDPDRPDHPASSPSSTSSGSTPTKANRIGSPLCRSSWRSGEIANVLGSRIHAHLDLRLVHGPLPVFHGICTSTINSYQCGM
jgi:hypothetical protein